MALLNTAINNVFAALADRKIRPGNRAAVQSMQEMYTALTNAYDIDVNLTVSDATDADLGVFFVTTGGLRVALGRDAAVGDIFSVNGSGDTTDDALEGAKGSAVAATDLFEVTNISTEAVVYLGQVGDLDFTGEETADFVSIGS